MEKNQEEKAIAKQFFKTQLGKTVFVRLKRIKELEMEVMRLSQELNKKQSLPLESEMTEEKDRQVFVNNAISLFYDKKAPQYLFSMYDYINNTEKRCYTTDLDELMQPIEISI